MSYSTMITFDTDGSARTYAEFRNSHGCASAVWTILARKYRGCAWYELGEEGMSGLWRIVDDRSIPKYDRLVMAWTFDNTIVLRHQLLDMAAAIDEFTAANLTAHYYGGDPQYVYHMPQVAAHLRELHKDPNVRAVGMNQTSCGSTKIYTGVPVHDASNEFCEAPDEPCECERRPYNLDQDIDHVILDVWRSTVKPPLVVCAGLVVDAQGRVLMAQRAPRNAAGGSQTGGLWELPGGKREAGETYEECAQRELAEELGIDVQVDGLVSVVTMKPNRRAYPFRLYACQIVGTDQPKALAGQQAVEWVNLKTAITDRHHVFSTYAVYKDAVANVYTCERCKGPAESPLYCDACARVGGMKALAAAVDAENDDDWYDDDWYDDDWYDDDWYDDDDSWFKG